MNRLNALKSTLASLPPLTFKDKCTAVAALVAPLFLIVALSLMIKYAVHPIPRMVRLAPHFSLSLPVVICGGASIGLTLILVAQIYTGFTPLNKLKQAYIRSIMYLGKRPSGQTPVQYAKTTPETVQKAENEFGKQVTFSTRDNVTLGGFWHETSTPKQSPTLIFFHGNMDTAERACSHWGKYYKDLGFNVLVVEYRGYGISEGTAGGPNQEMEAYLDAEAALQFVLAKGIPKENITAHGMSLGGAYAAALGCFFDVPRVILDQTFTSLAAICATQMPGDSWDTAILAVYAQGKHLKHPEIPGAQDLVTDGFNTINKVGKMKGKVLVIGAKDDAAMPKNSARQLEDVKNNGLITLEGARHGVHCFTLVPKEDGSDTGTKIFDEDAARKLLAFLPSAKPRPKKQGQTPNLLGEAPPLSLSPPNTSP